MGNCKWCDTELTNDTETQCRLCLYLWSKIRDNLSIAELMVKELSDSDVEGQNHD